MAPDIFELAPDFDTRTPSDRISIVGWYLHERKGLETFDGPTLRATFKEMHAEPPPVSVYLPRMAAKRPPIMVKQGGGYRLAGPVRRSLSEQLGSSQSSVSISALLKALPDRIPTLSERVFLQETLACYKAGAFRAATVMAWNLAYDHLMRWMVADQRRLDEFNSSLAARFPKKAIVVKVATDLSELKESEVIDVLKSARLVTKNVADLLREKLIRRNAAAHPSDLVVSQHQADDTISDLVINVVLAIS